MKLQFLKHTRTYVEYDRETEKSVERKIVIKRWTDCLEDSKYFVEHHIAKQLGWLTVQPMNLGWYQQVYVILREIEIFCRNQSTIVPFDENWIHRITKACLDNWLEFMEIEPPSVYNRSTDMYSIVKYEVEMAFRYHVLAGMHYIE